MRAVRTGTSIWSKATSLLARALAVESADVRHAVDALEPRALLANSPLPTLADLESANNTVVRLETTFGDIDIELFNSAAPITVANFLNYVTSGRFDETFFHRSAFNGANPFVLQGGAFRYDDTAGFSATTTDAAIIRESTGRSNLARTLAMARTSAINSATNQFFINYVDNTFLDPTGPNDGYAVFARVIQGWDVVTTIQGLTVVDLSADPAFAGPNQGAMGEVPTTSSYNSTVGVRENALVNIINAEIIKPANVDGFFSQRVVFPEGFRSGNATETLDLANHNSATATYQIIAHYELGDRDVVIATGTIGANSTARVRLSDFADSSLNILRQASMYALVVESAVPSSVTAPVALGAQVTRTDFGSTTSESAFNPSQYTNAQLRTWTLPRLERNSLSREFVLWQNLSSEAAVITTTFFTTSGQVTDVRVAEPYRRGGLDLAALTLSTGVLGVRITSTQNIAVLGSDWDLRPANLAPVTGQSVYTPGFTVMGIAGGGQNAGGIAGVSNRTGFTDIISIFNPGNTVAAVTLNFWTTARSTGADPIQRFEIVLANGRTDYAVDFGLLGIASGEIVSVTYTSGAASVSMQYTSAPSTGRNTNVANTLLRDGAAATFSSNVSQRVTFAGGSLTGDGTGLDGANGEILSIFNPYGADNVNVTYSVKVNFADGTEIEVLAGTLTANKHLDFNIASNSAVRTKALSATQYRNYSITVTGQSISGVTTRQVAPLVLLTRGQTGTTGYIASNGLTSGPLIALNDAQFAAGSGG